MGYFPVADTGDTAATVGTPQAPSVLGPAQRHEKRSLQHSVSMAGSSTRLHEVRIPVDWSAGVGAEILGADFSGAAQDRPQVGAEECSGAWAGVEERHWAVGEDSIHQAGKRPAIERLSPWVCFFEEGSKIL